MRVINFTAIFMFFICIDLAIIFATFTIPSLQNVVAVSAGIDITDIYSSFYAQQSKVVSVDVNSTIPWVGDFWATVWLSVQLLALTAILLVKMPVIVTAVMGYFGIPPTLAGIFITLNTIVFMITAVNVYRKLRSL